MAEDHRLPPSDRDPDDVQTAEAHRALTLAELAPLIAQLDVALEDVAAVLDAIPDSQARAVHAHRLAQQLITVRDRALRDLVLVYNLGPKQIARETGIGVGTVTLACASRPTTR